MNWTIPGRLHFMWRPGLLYFTLHIFGRRIHRSTQLPAWACFNESAD